MRNIHICVVTSLSRPDVILIYNPVRVSDLPVIVLVCQKSERIHWFYKVLSSVKSLHSMLDCSLSCLVNLKYSTALFESSWSRFSHRNKKKCA